MGAGPLTDGGVFRCIPVGIVPKVVAIIRKGDRGDGKVESLGEPMRGSRDSCEDFIIVGGGKF